ncbi:MAG: hypothetical protein GDA51_02480 [Ekhidna sp.]|nr:hypothetical protein [Ekhidna sp.]MBC6410282.1 hypothetical protein [Ekhidna sp.]MBC6425341.1 hypothetical protein [Ekhidna sp.]
MIKAVRVLNLFSTLLFAAVLLLVYAYLPISVNLNLEQLGNLHKQDFFYRSLIIFLALNILLRLVIFYGLKRLKASLLSWVSGLIFVTNFYCTLLIGFIGVWNNPTHISPAGYGYLNIMGPIFLIIWLAGLIFLVFKKV